MVVGRMHVYTVHEGYESDIDRAAATPERPALASDRGRWAMAWCVEPATRLTLLSN